MGATKKHIYTEEQLALAEMFKALAHPARIAIVELLSENSIADDTEKMNCNALRKHIQLAQSTISEHIKQLHRSGVLGVSVVKNNAYYQVHHVALEVVIHYLREVSEKAKTITKNALTYCKPVPIALSNRLRNTT